MRPLRCRMSTTQGGSSWDGILNLDEVQWLEHCSADKAYAVMANGKTRCVHLSIDALMSVLTEQAPPADEWDPRMPDYSEAERLARWLEMAGLPRFRRLGEEYDGSVTVDSLRALMEAARGGEVPS